MRTMLLFFLLKKLLEFLCSFIVDADLYFHVKAPISERIYLFTLVLHAECFQDQVLLFMAGEDGNTETSHLLWHCCVTPSCHSLLLPRMKEGGSSGASPSFRLPVRSQLCNLTAIITET